MKKTLTVAALVLLAASLLWGQGKKDWKAPEAARKLKNPVAADKTSLEEGKQLYERQCLVCHGEKGDGNGPWVDKLPTKPGNFTDAKRMGGMTDGELFWKISKGRDQMPPFEYTLTEKARWQLVNFIRTFSSKPPAKKDG